ncbi:MAG: AAA family ATPase [Lachnospiraceae bacterium]|nr:AAA family ATPase [Lachnospiraceae bacterium]
MAAKHNGVYAAALQFYGKSSGITPEAVLFCYSKLLLMGEAALRSLLSEQELADLEGARSYLTGQKLDLNLVKTGMQLLIPLVQAMEEYRENCSAFEKYLESCSSDTTSEAILKEAVARMSVPLEKVFGEGKTMDSVFDYRTELKEKVDKQPKKEEPKTEPEKEEKSEPKESKPADTSSEKGQMQKTADEAEKTRQDNNDAEDSTLVGLSKHYRNLTSTLLDVVKGQDGAVAKFVQGCFQGEMLKRSEKGKNPRATFFFFGPPGVGKTLLAETAAEVMQRPYKIFNMSEYSSQYSHEELIGTPQMYKNAREGELVKFVRENPECILVFDEIEKAHLLVIRLFLQILGSGRLNNLTREEETSFTDAIVIFTSNVGKELYADRSVDLTSLPDKVIIDAIRNEKDKYGDPVLPNEICSRIASGNTIMFNHLSVRQLADMTERSFERVSEAMSEEYACHITFANTLPRLFLYKTGGSIDARVATKQSGNFLKKEIYEFARQIDSSRVSDKKISSIHFDVDWEGVSPEIKALFFNETKTEVLILADAKVAEKHAINEEKYKVYYASSLEEARKYLAQDIAAVFIDPFFGRRSDNMNILSIADYNTDGVGLFNELMESQASLPIHLVEVDKTLSETDVRTFLSEGAVSIVHFDNDCPERFGRHVEEILDEVYMEHTSVQFFQQGWVIDFKSKQEVGDDGKIKILFYDLKKRMAVDIESRGSVLSEAERPKVKFSDVIGAQKAKDDLTYYIDYLKNPKKFLLSGGKPPKGVLLYGPPGTGKTMLARAMAGESDITFIETSAASFKDKYVGESEANIRRVFARAKRYAPAIIFIDEIDAIGKKRTGSEVTAITESMLNALLTEMDGFKTDMKKPIFVLAATNYGVGDSSEGIADLDPALIRRFDNKIYVDLPNKEERETYIRLLLSKRKEAAVSDQVISNLADRTTGQSLAIINNVVDLAFRNALKVSDKMQDDDLLNALEEYMYGEKIERTPKYYRSVAIHETGHAYISYLGGDTPSYITIESRGNFGGYMQHGNSEEVMSYTKEDLLSKIRTSLAGRAAEEVFFSKEESLNTGASSDLRHATHYAFQMICSYGMGEHQMLTLTKEEILRSALAESYVRQVDAILQEQMKKTVALLEENREIVQAIADELISRNHLTGKEFTEIVERFKK